MITDYKGLKAVVTGGANGIGRAFALNFAKRGADVLVADIHPDEAAAVAAEIRKMGVQGYSIGADVSLKEDCKKIYDKTVEVFGRCDILVNNAGVSASGDFTNIPERDIRWVYEVNVFSHWFMLGYFLPMMEAQDEHAQIINVCSIAGLITSPASPAYFSSKHAAIALSEVLYKELKAKGSKIDVSIFAPGFVATEMHLTDRHRPVRYAINDDPYYHDEDYAKQLEISKYVTTTGAPLDEVMDYVFKLLGTECFYILTHDKYDALLRQQGVFQANKTRPIDLSDVQVKATL